PRRLRGARGAGILGCMKSVCMTRLPALARGLPAFLVLAGAAALRPAALAVVEYPLPRAGAFPHDPAVARDGTVWYTDQANSYIGRLDPETGKVSDYPTPTAASGPHGIVVAPDGGVWYTANFAGRLGRLDPATGAIREYPLPAASPPRTARCARSGCPTRGRARGAWWWTRAGSCGTRTMRATGWAGSTPRPARCASFPVPAAPVAGRMASRWAATAACGTTSREPTRSWRSTPPPSGPKRCRSPREWRWCATWPWTRHGRGCGSRSRGPGGSARSSSAGGGRRYPILRPSSSLAAVSGARYDCGKGSPRRSRGPAVPASRFRARARRRAARRAAPPRRALGRPPARQSPPQLLEPAQGPPRVPACRAGASQPGGEGGVHAPDRPSPRLAGARGGSHRAA